MTSSLVLFWEKMFLLQVSMFLWPCFSVSPSLHHCYKTFFHYLAGQNKLECFPSQVFFYFRLIFTGNNCLLSSIRCSTRIGSHRLTRKNLTGPNGLAYFSPAVGDDEKRFDKTDFLSPPFDILSKWLRVICDCPYMSSTCVQTTGHWRHVGRTNYVFPSACISNSPVQVLCSTSGASFQRLVWGL